MRVMAHGYIAGLLATPSPVPADLRDLCGGDDLLAEIKIEEIRNTGEAWIAAGAELNIQVTPWR